ncbi:MAG: sigma 54-interacting transcriptional regulator [Spirochaetota bacterium]|nr:sigma 54-interacting transcriptional regulator [Spirochaetota bacterium]
MNILIFDDRNEFACMLSDYIREKHEVIIADSLVLTKENILRNGIDIIIASIRDSNNNNTGIELLKIIKASAIEIPVIMTGTKEDITQAVDCFRLGALDCVDKTEIDDTKINSLIEKAIDARSKEGERDQSSRVDFNILFIDDNIEFTDAIKFHFGKRYRIDVSNDFNLARDIIDSNKYDCIFLDIRDEMNNDELAGIKLLKELMSNDEDVPVIMLTGWGEMSTAIECLKLGAYNFLEKSIKIFDTLEMIANVIEELIQKNIKDNNIHKKSFRYRVIDIIGECRSIRDIREEIIEVADEEVPVLIYGKTGTGKEVVSSAIHVASSRRDSPFVEVDCGSIPESIFESELFGYVKGAFTGAVDQRKGKIELADKGTLFLDEVENISLEQQAKLLKVLEEKKIYPLGSNKEREVDFRLICATNVDLFKLAEEGKFRQDLLYRINVFQIELPPLRERGEMDIDLLIRHFVSLKQNSLIEIEKYALQLLKKYDWPGNIRELRNILTKLEIIARRNNNNVISVDIVKSGFMKYKKDRINVDHLLKDLVDYYNGNVPNMLREYEDMAVLESYKNFNKNISKIAQKIYKETPEDNKNYRGRVRKVLERNMHLLNDPLSLE